ncbi:RagB/SusD family nutrient uptake outer membrane protein, partial [Bacteroides heparinolyticus]
REISFERKFEAPKNYLLPIPSDDVNRNPKLVNNPGY